MLRCELLRDRGVVVLTPQGPLEKADFESLARTLDPYIADKGKLAGLMIEARAFPGWADFAALAAHLKFIKSHHTKVERIAIVSEGGLMKHSPTIASYFVAPDIRTFGFGEKPQALAWLESGQR